MYIHLSASPFEPLHDAIFHPSQERAIDFRGESVVEYEVGAVFVRTECPYGTCSEEIPESGGWDGYWGGGGGSEGLEVGGKCV